jgi:dihydropteroate synthase
LIENGQLIGGVVVAIIRVHEVEASVRVVRMTEAILGRRPPAATRCGLA